MSNIMEKIVKNNITISGARIIFRDFAGKKNKFNNDRTFSVVLEDSLADRLYEDGWPVRWLEPRTEEDARTPILTVKMKFDKLKFVGYSFQIEMNYTATRLGFKVYEVPIIFTDRVLGTSKMSMKIFKEAFFGVFNLKFRDWKNY